MSHVFPANLVSGALAHTGAKNKNKKNGRTDVCEWELSISARGKHSRDPERERRKKKKKRRYCSDAHMTPAIAKAQSICLKISSR